MALKKTIGEVESFFWSRVHKRGSDECWLWLGSRQSPRRHRYGSYRNGLAHRFAFAATHGEIPPGLMVCHTCDIPLCCNPKHLWLGTAKDNNSDSTEKGRAFIKRGENHIGAKLSRHDILKIRVSLETSAALARAFSVTHATISDIRKGRTWAWLKQEGDQP